MSISINVVSLFRDSEEWHNIKISQVSKYFKGLQSQNYKLKYICLEGDSKDNTYSELLKYQQTYDVSIIRQYNDSYNEVKSTVDPNRIKGLSKIGNVALDEAAKYPADYVLWIESDLIISQDFIQSLLKHSTQNTIVFPIAVYQSKDILYDTWATRTFDGSKVSVDMGQLEVYSAGSAALIPFHFIQKGLRFGDGAFVELCEKARNKYGACLILDTNTKVRHPDNFFVKGRLI